MPIGSQALRRYVLWLWLLSGIPVGIALIFLPSPARLACFTLFILLETGHSLSPIVLAWTHGGFRRVMVGQPKKYFPLPSGVFAVAIGIGAATSLGWTSLVPGPGALSRLTDWANPLPVMVWVYWAWNIYHFGMQHFGVLSLWRGRIRSRLRLVGSFEQLRPNAWPVLTQVVPGVARWSSHRRRDCPCSGERVSTLLRDSLDRTPPRDDVLGTWRFVSSSPRFAWRGCRDRCMSSG
jgi:hypothetical protein